MSLVSACGGGGGGGGPDSSVTVTGAHTEYVVNNVAVPTSSTEATEYGLDIGAPLTDKPDGAVDNQLGNVLSALGGQGFDVTDTLNAAVAEGSIILLADFQSSDPTFMNASEAGLQILLGANPSPMPCGSDYGSNGEYDGSDAVADCGKQFSGGTFDIGSNSPSNAKLDGPLVNGTFNGGPGSISLQLALGGTNAITLSLENARSKASGISSTGITSLIVGGAISKTDIDTMVIPAIQFRARRSSRVTARTRRPPTTAPATSARLRQAPARRTSRRASHTTRARPRARPTPPTAACSTTRPRVTRSSACSTRTRWTAWCRRRRSSATS